MVQGNEIIALLVGVCVTLFCIRYRSELRSLPCRHLFYWAFGALMVARTITILEGFFYEDLLNLIEHSGYSASAILLALWSWRAFTPGEEQA